MQASREGSRQAVAHAAQGGKQAADKQQAGRQQAGSHLVEVEDEVQLAHIAKVLVQHLDKLVHHLQGQQLVVVCRAGARGQGRGRGS